MSRGEEYDRAFREREEAGGHVHGEADFVWALHPATVLDAGCGTGRVAIELARRGLTVVGVDVDCEMLVTARSKAPEIEWICADLSSLNLRDPGGVRRTFDVAVMAGNVMIFVQPGTEEAVVASAARHLVPGGQLVTGFQLRPGCLDLARYDDAAAAAGLSSIERWAGWGREPWTGSGDYVVSVHRF